MSTGSTGPSCWFPNLSLVNYKTELYPSTNILIDYVNISIVFSKFGYRIWNFTFAGNTSLTSFTQIFQYKKGCEEVPGALGPCRGNGIFFSPKGFKGILVVDNVTYGISNTEHNPIQWAWTPKIGMFELTVNLCNLLGYDTTTTTDPEREFFADLWIKDGNCGNYNCHNCPEHCEANVTNSTCKTSHC